MTFFDILKTSLYTPKFIGCQYTDENVFIAKTYLSVSLNDPIFRNKIKFWSVSKSIAFYIQLVKGLRGMWNAGLVQNDIKPDNMMTDRFGVSSYTKNFVPKSGFPVYMPLSKFVSSQIEPRPCDDLYSLALSIGVIEAEKRSQEVFSYNSNRLQKQIPEKCYTIRLDSSCRNQYRDNIEKILTKAKYGDYIPVVNILSDPRINFTTLISKLLKFTTCSFGYVEIIDTFERIKANE